jgi:hypothetical protein
VQRVRGVHQTGNAKPYKGPKSKRLGKKYGTLVNMVSGVDDFSDEIPDDEPDEPEAPTPVDTIGQLKLLGELRDGGVLTPEEFEVQKALLLGSAPPPPVKAIQPSPPGPPPPPGPDLGDLPPPPGGSTL